MNLFVRILILIPNIPFLVIAGIYIYYKVKDNPNSNEIVFLDPNDNLPTQYQDIINYVYPKWLGLVIGIGFYSILLISLI
jgi:hypothetical protein